MPIDVGKGLRRVAKAIRFLGWTLGLLFIVVGAYAIWLGGKEDTGGFLFIGGLVGMGIAYGLAWIIEGFASDQT